MLSDAERQRALDSVIAVGPIPELIVAIGSLPPGVPDDLYARLVRERGAV
jgi:6-phosphofructokinase 2